METAPFYSMHRLMHCEDLEAFAAQKKAGSIGAYVALLEAFRCEAPGIVAGLGAPGDKRELDLFLRDIKPLQKHLFAIGSSALFWMTEKAIAAAKAKEREQCHEMLHNLSKRVAALCNLLQEAKRPREGAGAPAAVAPAPPASPEAAMPAQRPRAPVKQELFEKLNLLITNFERDDAVNMLRELRACTYTDDVDTLLGAIAYELSHSDYTVASVLSQQLLKGIQDAQVDAEQKPRKKILAIDDAPDLLNTVKSVLKNDYAVYGVTTHTAALKFLMNNRVDLILLDVHMPDMDGFVLLDIIRKIIPYKTTPVLFLTGNASKENIHKACRAGGNDFLKKPVDARLLAAKIKKHLG